MPQVKFALPNGTLIEVEGAAGEITPLLDAVKSTILELMASFVTQAAASRETSLLASTQVSASAIQPMASASTAIAPTSAPSNVEEKQPTKRGRKPKAKAALVASETAVISATPMTSSEATVVTEAPAAPLQANGEAVAAPQADAELTKSGRKKAKPGPKKGKAKKKEKKEGPRPSDLLEELFQTGYPKTEQLISEIQAELKARGHSDIGQRNIFPVLNQLAKKGRLIKRNEGNTVSFRLP